MDQNKEKAWLFIRRDLQQLLRLTMQKLVSLVLSHNWISLQPLNIECSIIF